MKWIVFKAMILQCKAILGREQWDESCPRCRIACSTYWLAFQLCYSAPTPPPPSPNLPELEFEFGRLIKLKWPYRNKQYIVTSRVYCNTWGLILLPLYLSMLVSGRPPPTDWRDRRLRKSSWLTTHYHPYDMPVMWCDVTCPPEMGRWSGLRYLQ